MKASLSTTAGWLVVMAVSIAAPVEKVWAAVTEPEHIARWFPNSEVLDRVDVRGTGLFTFEAYGDFPVRIQELDPPRTIAYRGGNDNASAVLQDVGLVEPVRVGREVRYRVLGSQLSETARDLDRIGAEWDRRLAEIKQIAESL